MAWPTRLSKVTIDQYLRAGLWRPESLSDWWDAQAARRPDALAVADGTRRLTWAEARVWTDRASLGLISLGLARDDVLIIQLPNCVELPLLRVACEKAGVVSLPVPSSWRHHELGQCLVKTRAGGVVVPGAYRGFDYLAMVQELRSRVPRLQHVILWGEDAPRSAIGLEELASPASGGRVAWTELESRRYRALEVSMINATTGSTGLPKHAEFTAAARLLYGRAYVDAFALTEGDRVAALSPAAGGPNIPVYFAAPQVGAAMVFLRHFDPEAAFELIEREKATVVCMVPAQLSMMVHHPAVGRYDLSRVRCWINVSAPLSPPLAREAEARLGGVVTNTYGAVDWGGVVFTGPDDPPEVRHGTVGRPRVGTEVRLVGEEGRLVAPGEVGELQGRGPSCSSGYQGESDATAQAWTADGWLPLGDLGHWDDEGNLVIVGRKSDLINRGGENIAPTEIEEHLLAHPRVGQAAVLGMPDPIMGERVCAYVVPAGRDAPTLEELVAFLRGRQIAAYKLPERLEVAEALPMVSDTKVDKGRLAADLAGRLGREGLGHG